MRIPLPTCMMPKPKKLTAEDVLRSELRKAHDIHPGQLMPSSVLSALEDAGFVIMSTDDLDNEIALAYQAGADDAGEAE